MKRLTFDGNFCDIALSRAARQRAGARREIDLLSGEKT